MKRPGATGERETVAARLLASLCALGVCGALFAAQQLHTLTWNGPYSSTSATLTVLGAIAVVTLVSPWLAGEWRRTWGLGGSIAVGALLLRGLIVVPVGFAWLSVRVSRLSWPLWTKLVLLLGLWAVLILLRASLPHSTWLPYQCLWLYWACLPAPVICLMVERARGQLDDVRASDEWAYLLALPRFFLPFLQPIGAARFIRSRAPQSPRLSLKALGLGLYAAACLFALRHAHYALRASGEAFELVRMSGHVLQTGVLIYAVNASGIFCAVALLRLLGYDLGSGFRFPLLATSFSDLYRRWNYYFYEFVSTILYLPLVTALRRRVPLWVAYVLAGYLSVLLGVWAADNVTFQFAIAGFGPTFWREATDGRDLLVHLAVWSLIIVPQVALMGLRRWRTRAAWRFAMHVAFLTTGVGVLGLLSWYGVTLY